MGRQARPVIETPPGFKRCRHCAKNANTFIDVRDKHNECEQCRVNRQKSKRRGKGEPAEEIASVWDSGYFPSLPEVPNYDFDVPMSVRSTVKDGKRVTKHMTTSDTCTMFESKQHAFAELIDLAKTSDAFRFHGRYIADDPPALLGDEDENRALGISYVHNLNADVGEALGWRWTSRGRENKKNARHTYAVHYNCCQDADRSKPRKEPKNPVKPGKRKAMDRFHCNGRMTIAYEPEHHVVELRLVHELNHPAYEAARKDKPRRVERAPIPIAAPSGLSALAQITDPPMLSAQEASMLYPGSAGPGSPLLDDGPPSPPDFMTIDPSLQHHVGSLHHHHHHHPPSHLDVPVPVFGEDDHHHHHFF